MSVRRASLPSVGLTISRGQLMAGLFIFTSTSGLLPRLSEAFSNEELAQAASLIPSTPALLFGAPGHQHAIWLFLRMIAIEFDRSILPLRAAHSQLLRCQRPR